MTHEISQGIQPIHDSSPPGASSVGMDGQQGHGVTPPQRIMVKLGHNLYSLGELPMKNGKKARRLLHNPAPGSR